MIGNYNRTVTKAILCKCLDVDIVTFGYELKHIKVYIPSTQNVTLEILSYYVDGYPYKYTEYTNQHLISFEMLENVYIMLVSRELFSYNIHGDKYPTHIRKEILKMAKMITRTLKYTGVDVSVYNKETKGIETVSIEVTGHYEDNEKALKKSIESVVDGVVLEYKVTGEGTRKYAMTEGDFIKYGKIVNSDTETE